MKEVRNILKTNYYINGPKFYLFLLAIIIGEFIFLCLAGTNVFRHLGAVTLLVSTAFSLNFNTSPIASVNLSYLLSLPLKRNKIILSHFIEIAVFITFSYLTFLLAFIVRNEYIFSTILASYALTMFLSSLLFIIILKIVRSSSLVAVFLFFTISLTTLIYSLVLANIELTDAFIGLVVAILSNIFIYLISNYLFKKMII